MFSSTSAFSLRYPREAKSRQLIFNMNTKLITTAPCMPTKKKEGKGLILREN